MTLLPLLFTVSSLLGQKVDFYIGTYTSKSGSEGIYRASLDTATGILTTPELVAKTHNPSFLALHPTGRFLYSVDESSVGHVNAFAIEPNKTLTHLNFQTTLGADPCHISVDKAGKHVFVANYSSGSLISYSIKSDGRLAVSTHFFQNFGAGPDKSRQEGPHMHFACTDADDKHVYACDLGTDAVLVFDFDSATGALKLNTSASGKTPPGGGPRHFVLHSNGRFAYSNNEMGNGVNFYDVDPGTGGLSLRQTLSSLPAGDRTHSHTAELVCHPNGKWLYVSNRGHESIASYSIGDDGTLSLIEIQKAGVNEPRGFEIDPSGKWLVVAGQNSNDITALSIDPASGKLAPGPNKVSLSKPVCIVFAK